MRYFLSSSLLLLAFACGDKDPDDTGEPNTTDGSTDTAMPVTTGPEVEPGGVALCAGVESSDAYSETVSVSGTIVDMGVVDGSGAPVDAAEIGLTPYSCIYDDTRYISVEDADGLVWHFGYMAHDAADQQLAPELAVTVGDAVEVDLAQDIYGYSFSAGLAVRSGGVLIGAFVDAVDSSEPLAEVDLGGLSSTPGAVYATVGSACGSRQYHQLDVGGDTSTTLEIGDQTTITHGGSELSVYHADAWTLVDNDSCTDHARAVVEWAVWR